MTLSLVRVLGWLVVGHALSHAVLPLRGSLAPTLVGDWIPAVLYAVAMVGFLAAGLGLLGLRPVNCCISPLLVLASGMSLVAIARLGDPRLWFGAAFDVVLMAAGLWRAYGGWPSHPQHSRVWHVVGVTGGLALLLYVAIAAALYPWHRTWGSRPDEIRMALPGDESTRAIALEIQHAITIEAPPERIWPWLVQLGQDRAGFYSYDWLERAFGADVRNVRELRPEWQTRRVGDFVRATQPGYLGGIFGHDLGWRVTEFDPPNAMVLEHWGSFVLQPHGNGQTRFIIRSTISHPDIATWASALNLLAFELPHFIMERRMMLTIKSLAEAPHGVREARR